MWPLVCPRVPFWVLFFSASIPPLLFLLLPLSQSVSSNLPMTHNFIFLSLHLTSLVKSIAFKNVSLPCTPGAVITLSLNPGKSDSVLFGTRQRSHSFSDITTVNVSGSDHLKLLGVTLDNHLSMDKHVNEVSRACFYHLRALRHIRPAITARDTNMIDPSAGLANFQA